MAESSESSAWLDTMSEQDREFIRYAKGVGFTDDQAHFMLEYLSLPGHHHTPEQIDGIDEAIEAALDEHAEESADEDDEEY